MATPSLPQGLNTPCCWVCLAGGLARWPGAFPTRSRSGPRYRGSLEGTQPKVIPALSWPQGGYSQLSGWDALILWALGKWSDGLWDAHLSL